MRPPALLVEHGKLKALGEPDGKVVVHGPSALEFCHPDIAAAHALALAPSAELAKAVGKVTRLPVVHASVGEGDEPNVLPVARQRAEALQLATRPNRAAQAAQATGLGFLEAERNIDVVVSTCFRWDKPSVSR